MAQKYSKADSTSKKRPSQLRMRVFAGPNGSGKTTLIEGVRSYKFKGIPIDLGIYINADDIATNIRRKTFKLSDYNVSGSKHEITAHALKAGFLGQRGIKKAFKSGLLVTRNQTIIVKHNNSVEKISQIIADYLRTRLLQKRAKFSFETVLSHPSKLSLMQKAKTAGYKVYLYFVATESPDINVFRVLLRKGKGGHSVKKRKIYSRYYKSLSLMYRAAQLSYQAFFFDNSGTSNRLIANFKVVNKKKRWSKVKGSLLPSWFADYYLKKAEADS